MTMPLWSADTVSVPTASAGSSRSTRGSRAVPSARASAASTRPGRMAPPRKKPSPSTASTVVAVPRSTTMTGLPWSEAAAQAARSRSGPVLSGRSNAVPMGMWLAETIVSGSPTSCAARSRRSVQRSTTLTATIRAGAAETSEARSARTRRPSARSAAVATAVSRRPDPKSLSPSTRAALSALLPMSTAMITRPIVALAARPVRASTPALPSPDRCRRWSSAGAHSPKRTRAVSGRVRVVRATGQVLRQQRPGLEPGGHLPPAAAPAAADRGLPLPACRQARLARDRLGGAHRGRPAGRLLVLHAALDLPLGGLLGAPRVRDAAGPAHHLHARPGRRARHPAVPPATGR